MNTPCPQIQNPRPQPPASRPQRRVARSLARHLRLGARARELYQRAEAELNAALLLQPPLGEAIRLPDGRCVVVVDLFAQKHVAYSAKVFHRYQVTDWKAPKTAKAATAPEPADATPQPAEVAA
ncbi:MAG TPA: hypothetical protein VMB21_20530 [Candidatus Limnocylindria bacterium]|jgi:hypothetical protein|nr:hypothetical protein [Candidatus Limnocylindria bacterium]